MTASDRCRETVPNLYAHDDLPEVHLGVRFVRVEPVATDGFEVVEVGQPAGQRRPLGGSLVCMRVNLSVSTRFFMHDRYFAVVLAALLGSACTSRTQSASPSPSAAVAGAATLDIYFIDVEGGQSTLIKTPAGEAFLIDAGFPGDGTFASKPADPTEARDAQRILAAAHDAHVQRIDYLLVTHFHADHVGGVVELSNLLPIVTFIDHAAPLPEAEAAVVGTTAIYNAYVGLRDRSRRLEPKPGDRLPLRGVDAVIVSSAGDVLRSPLAGGGKPNPSCSAAGVPAQEKTENPRSTGVRIQYGAFRFVDVGDLTGAPLQSLVCPINLLGEANVYLIAHHGGDDAAHPATFHALNPQAVVFNNGPRKGGGTPTLATVSGLRTTDGWQLHRSLNVGAVNASDDRIANFDERTSHWLKLSARADGSFTMTNSRTGQTKSYPAR